jgi:hypothetical protein
MHSRSVLQRAGYLKFKRASVPNIVIDSKRLSEFRRLYRDHNPGKASMSKIVDEVIAANKKYVSDFGAKKDLALPPARGFAILTCMDARLDPAKYAGLSEGDAHVIGNAGGRATDDAVRSLVISHKLLGTREWFVIHHTNCGMELLMASWETCSRTVWKLRTSMARFGRILSTAMEQAPGNTSNGTRSKISR